MKDGYVIQWKSKVNGRAGRGTKQFARDEAQKLCAELNHEYPEIVHEAIAFKSIKQAAPQEEEAHAVRTH